MGQATPQHDVHFGHLEWHYAYYDFAHLFLALEYFLLFCYAVWVALRLYCGKANMIRWQKTFNWLTAGGSLARTVFFALQVPLREGEIRHMPNRVNFMLNMLPSFLFFVCYLIILFLWAEIYHTTNKQDLKDPSLQIKKLLPVFYTIVTLLFIVVLSLTVLDFAMYEKEFKTVAVHTNEVEMTIVVVVGGMYLLSSCAFLFYGSRFYYDLHRSGTTMFTVQTRRQRIVLEVQVITVIYTLCFIIRGGMTLFQIFTSVAISQYWYTDFVYFTLLELLPLLVLLFILRPRKAAPSYKATDDFSPLINTSYE